MRKVLGVDVDLTVVRTDLAWIEWLNNLTGRNVIINEEVNDTYPYDLTKLYPGEMFTWGDGLDFWREEGVYDKLSPIEGTVEFLREASKTGWDVVFISQIKGNHQKSKYYFLKKHFPFMAGAIWTKEKHYVRVDAMIDDRVKVLNKMPDNVQCILKTTPYSQCEQLKRTADLFDWNTTPQEILK